MTLTLDDIFGQDGLLARALPRYENRTSQLRMAEMVERAFYEGRNLVVEAGTGTGKTLAYLVPAILAAVDARQASAADGKFRVVVSTGTKNLQEQIIEKDIPLLNRILPLEFSVALVKGRSNYLCLRRLDEVLAEPLFDSFAVGHELEEVVTWSESTDTGDQSELSTIPEKSSLWRRLDARSEICTGMRCAQFADCFITRLRQRTDAAEIIVVNHHLFFADLLLRAQGIGSVLPDYHAVILDEAHEIEEVAAQHFGTKISSAQFSDLVGDIERTLGPQSNEAYLFTRILSRACETFWSALKSACGSGAEAVEINEKLFLYNADDVEEFDPTSPGQCAAVVDDALRRLAVYLDTVAYSRDQAELLLGRTNLLRSRLAAAVACDDQRNVYWLESKSNGRSSFQALHVTPIDVSDLLREKLFNRVSPVILTSATLSTGGDFSHIIERIGVPAGSLKLIASSPFDYAAQAVLYLPSALPDPRTPEWQEEVAAETIAILNATKGRAFVLSTSNRMMRFLYERANGTLPFPCFLQGEAPRSRLIESFRATPNAVLFATSSFWQGVDVQGDQLSCVIIDRIPFNAPTDPVLAARLRAIDESGGSSFTQYSLPSAILTLKQGAGRLIRSMDDTGVLSILDPRLRTKGYGRYILKSLPPFSIVSNLTQAIQILCRY